MYQFDHSAMVFFWLLGFVILAPLAIFGVFAVSEFFHERRNRKKKHLRILQRAARR